MAQKKKSNNKTTKKVVKTATKMAKKNPAVFIVIFIIIAALAVGLFFLWTYVISPKLEQNKANQISSSEPTSSLVSSEPSSAEPSSSSQSVSSSSSTPFIGDVAPMDIYFLELGNKYTGDSTFIKAGDVDILIDAGSRKGSAQTIYEFVKDYCKDGILEYVIATHAHQDHIAGFVGTTATESAGILKRYQIGTLIDFSLTNATSSIYNEYVSLRDEKVASGSIAHHYTANDCIQGNNGAQKVYNLAPGITMEILDQKFYREKTSDENDYSVCALFTQGNNHYPFTGDLEKDGEASLVASNNLPEVELFKGGHHGSYTANTDTLLNVIRPKTVCICCCAGSEEYTDNVDNMFPAQAAINRMGKWTDKIYVTTLTIDYKNSLFTSMNGNINFHCTEGKEYAVTGSNNSTILKDTDWFKNNRTWPTY